MKKIIVLLGIMLGVLLVGCGSKEVSDIGKSNDGKFTFTIVGGEVAQTTNGDKVMNVTIKMENHSGNSASPIQSNCGVWGVQNGEDMDLEYDTELQKADNYTVAGDGGTLEYNVLLKMSDDSPVTVQVKDKSNNEVIAQKVIG